MSTSFFFQVVLDPNSIEGSRSIATNPANVLASNLSGKKSSIYKTTNNRMMQDVKIMKGQNSLQPISFTTKQDGGIISINPPMSSALEKKVCLWPLDDGSGATCGKSFAKDDSLRRHLTEAHQGMLVMDH